MRVSQIASRFPIVIIFCLFRKLSILPPWDQDNDGYVHSYRVKQLCRKRGIAHVIIAASTAVSVNVSASLPKQHNLEKIFDSIAALLWPQPRRNRVAIAVFATNDACSSIRDIESTYWAGASEYWSEKRNLHYVFPKTKLTSPHANWTARLCDAMADSSISALSNASWTTKWMFLTHKVPAQIPWEGDLPHKQLCTQRRH